MRNIIQVAPDSVRLNKEPQALAPPHSHLSPGRVNCFWKKRSKPEATHLAGKEGQKAAVQPGAGAKDQASVQGKGDHDHKGTWLLFHSRALNDNKSN